MRVMYHVYVSRITVPFLLLEISNSPFVSLWKSSFLPQTNTSYASVCSKTKLPNWPKSECQLWKFTTVQVCVMGEGFSGPKKIRIENHQSQPTSMTFWTASETNTAEHCLWLAHFFLALRRAVSLGLIDWSCLLDLTSLFRIKNVIYVYSFGIPKPNSRKKNFSISKR